MAYQEYVQKAIETGKSYDELPAKVKGAVSLPEWKQRVRRLCIQAGAPWDASAARGVCSEAEYYEDLVATYRDWGRLYPYHLAEYVARILRVTPFRYYIDLLFLCLKEERSYDRIPNFTAADALRLTGVGRNEYIALMNACRSKRLMWRLNKGIARELLPQAPLDIRMEPWWRVCVVNVGESEFRDLSGQECLLLRAAADGPRPLPVSAFEAALLQQVYKKGLVYLAIPIGAEDRFNIPPLEGFVSNKTSEEGDASVDPFEPLLYRLFLANSSRLDQARLADILGTDLQQLQLATALAVRLGFATRLNPGSSDELTAAAAGTQHAGGSSSFAAAALSSGVLPLAASAAAAAAAGSSSSQALTGGGSSGAIPDSVFEESAVAAAGGGAAGEGGAAAAAAGDAAGGLWAVGSGGGGSVAVVVDAETTSFLMMGALSAGLKRHSVSLFEGGRVSGPAVMDELIGELAASAEAGALFEGEDMAQLMSVIQSLGVLLAHVRAAVTPLGHSLELLRQESFAGLDPLSASKVLSATYTAILPISQLPGHTLPRLLCHQLLSQQQQQQPQTGTSAGSAGGAGGGVGGSSVHGSSSSTVAPTFFGPPSPEADSPWLQLALYAAARAGPVSLVFVAGCRVWRLPPQLQGCTHALLWGWGPAAAGAAAGGGGGAATDTRPLLVEGANLLCTLNELLSRTAVMVQPLVHLDQLPPTPLTATAAAAAQEAHLVRFVDVPLPLLRPSSGVEQQQQQQQQDSVGAGGGLAAATAEGAASLPTAAAAAGGDSAVLPAAAAAVAQGAAAWDPFGLSGWVAPKSSQSGPHHHHQQQQQQVLVVTAVERIGAATGQCRQLELPAQVVSALTELQLFGAVGWLRLVRLPPPPAAAAAAGTPAGSHPGSATCPWVPLSANLGVPLFCPTLCQLVCDSMAQQQTLTPAGEAAWRAAQQRLQRLLADHVSVAEGQSSSSGRGDGSEGAAVLGGSSSSEVPADRAGAGSGAAAQAPGACVAASMVGGDVTLPSRSLLFDGHSLLPVDISSCLQGVQLW